MGKKKPYTLWGENLDPQAIAQMENAMELMGRYAAASMKLSMHQSSVPLANPQS